jgi:hypothetical protein
MTEGLTTMGTTIEGPRSFGVILAVLAGGLTAFGTVLGLKGKN